MSGEASVSDQSETNSKGNQDTRKLGYRIPENQDIRKSGHERILKPDILITTKHFCNFVL